MKKSLKGVLLLISIFLLTGCVKFNYDMDISATKSVKLSIIYALDTNYFGEDYFEDGDFIDEAGKKKLAEEGFSVKDYEDGTYKGYTITKKIKNIDDVSATNAEKYNLSSLTDEDYDAEYIFKVEKGFFKNKYIASFSFDGGDSGLSYTDKKEGTYPSDTLLALEDDDDDDYWSTYDEDDDYWISTDEEDDETVDGDLENLTKGLTNSLDLSFRVRLPYKPISHNATSVSKNGKELTWKLSTDEQPPIEFTFELYNPMAIILCVGLPLLLIIAGIIIVITKKKKKTADPSVIASETASVEPVPEQGLFDNPNNLAGSTPTIEPIPTEPAAVSAEPVSAEINTPEPTTQVAPTEVQETTPEVAAPSLEQTPAAPVAEDNNPVVDNNPIDSI